jgi:hypothetical protein
LDPGGDPAIWLAPDAGGLRLRVKNQLLDAPIGRFSGVKVTHLLQADSDILENVCAENEKDRARMKGSDWFGGTTRREICHLLSGSVLLRIALVNKKAN